MTQAIVRSDGGYDEAKTTKRDYVCGDCEAPLIVVNRDEEWLAQCGQRPGEHKALKRIRDLERDELRANLERNPGVASELAQQNHSAPLTTEAIKTLDNDKLLARIPARYGTSIEVSAQERLMLAQMSRMYGLDPLWDLMIYEHRPYVTYEGRLRKMREHPAYQGHRVYPMDPKEKEQWGYEPGDLVIVCEVTMRGRGVITDYGVVRQTEVDTAIETGRRNNKRPAPVATHRQQIALKRAVTRTSRAAVGIDLPTIIEGSARVMVTEASDGPARKSLPEGGDAARRRFWAIARSGPPDGLGLDDQTVHALLGVESLSNYPGGWDQALSDLTERAAEREGSADAEWFEDEDESTHEDRQEGAEPVAPEGSSHNPVDDDPDLLDAELKKNASLIEECRAVGAKGLGPLTAKPGWTLDQTRDANAELKQRLRSRNGELDRQAASQSGQAKF